MQIAVAEMPERDHARARHGLAIARVGFLDEVADARNRHRDIVLDVQAFLSLRERDVFAQIPERPRLREVFRDHRVFDQTFFERGFHQALEQSARVFLALAVRQFQQHDLRMRFGERIAHLLEMPAHQPQTEIRHQFEAGQKRPGDALRERQEIERRMRRRERGERRDARGRLRMQLEHGGGDDAERAFRADEQIAQVVAGVVLAQSAQAVPQFALRR